MDNNFFSNLIWLFNHYCHIGQQLNDRLYTIYDITTLVIRSVVYIFTGKNPHFLPKLIWFSHMVVSIKYEATPAFYSRFLYFSVCQFSGLCMVQIHFIYFESTDYKQQYYDRVPQKVEVHSMLFITRHHSMEDPLTFSANCR